MTVITVTPHLSPARVRSVLVLVNNAIEIDRMCFPDIWVCTVTARGDRVGAFLSSARPSVAGAAPTIVHCVGPGAEADFLAGRLTATEAFWSTSGPPGQWALYTTPSKWSTRSLRHVLAVALPPHVVRMASIEVAS